MALSTLPAATDSAAPVRRRRRPRGQIVLHIYLTLIALFSIAPLLLAWSTAFKDRAQIVSNPYGPPIPLALDNLQEAWVSGRFSQYFLSSVIISVASVLLMVIVAPLAGYGLARMKFWGRRFLMVLLLLGLTIPVTAIVLPLYTIVRDLGLLNSYAGVVLVHVAMGAPFFAFIMRAFFLRLPEALEDAARVDGCSELRIFWSIMLPLVRPGVLTVALLEFLWTWNNLLLPLVFLTNEQVRTLPIGMLLLTGRFSTDYGLLSAAVLILSAPVVVLFLIFQRRFVEGLASGSVKG
ncbi:ABC-type glycerol-3-phosphate transport system permease component [Microbacterium sp. AK009]|uniref:carbohydrate ABC transporter permease n=1 Tax=Microbacterium sp. AK009 TaxID=2723068 RepID=UPI0015C71AB0|nr:carbohydrate ABC transporter permease [Microbacterium sp. AK009]NYF16617.1 ABC-type glycerol-3-phosphate transport system permease component [Microbacterium sp. AK009]